MQRKLSVGLDRRVLPEDIGERFCTAAECRNVGLHLASSPVSDDSDLLTY